MSVTSEHAEAGLLGDCLFCGESVWDDQDYVSVKGSFDYAHRCCFEDAMAEMKGWHDTLEDARAE